MKSMGVALIIFTSIAAAQTAPAEGQKPSPETVVATIDGKKLTQGELDGYMQVLSAQAQQGAKRDPKQFIQQFALMQRLSGMAEKARLDQKSPYREAIALNRMTLLMQAQINTMYESLSVPADDQMRFYEENKSRYEQVKLKAIYIPFSSNSTSAPGDGAKRFTEAEAKAKVEQLVRELRSGADFVKLVKENSEDATSKAKDGDFGTIAHNDNMPEPVKKVVFALKVGEVSEPVRQPNGFYIFRAEAISPKPFPEVQVQIYTELKNAKLKEWMDSNTKSLNIKFEDAQAPSGSALTAPAAQVPAK
jgi:parvulin-like peptidyl-prolyl isomerase